MEDDFAQTVRQRHEANSPFSADELRGMTDDQYKVILNDVASMQRGKPETAMERAQVEHSGLYGNSLEHVGDLTHRMNEPYATHGSRFNAEYVVPKVNNEIAKMDYPYGYAREIGEQLVSNRQYREKTGRVAPSDEDLASLRGDYTLAHHQLPVYNEPGYHAKAAAVHLGLQNYDKAREHLGVLQQITANQDRYNHLMSREGAIDWMERNGPA